MELKRNSQWIEEEDYNICPCCGASVDGVLVSSGGKLIMEWGYCPNCGERLSSRGWQARGITDDNGLEKVR